MEINNQWAKFYEISNIYALISPKYCAKYSARSDVSAHYAIGPKYQILKRKRITVPFENGTELHGYKTRPTVVEGGKLTLVIFRQIFRKRWSTLLSRFVRFNRYLLIILQIFIHVFGYFGGLNFLPHELEICVWTSNGIRLFGFVMYSWWDRRNCEHDVISPIVKPVSRRIHNKNEVVNWFFYTTFLMYQSICSLIFESFGQLFAEIVILYLITLYIKRRRVASNLRTTIRRKKER